MPKNFQFGRKKRHSKPRGVAAVKLRHEVQLDENTMETDIIAVETVTASSVKSSVSPTDVNTSTNSASSSAPAQPSACSSAGETRVEGKLAAFNLLDTDHLGYSSGGHYVLMHTSVLSELVSKLSCPTCNAIDLIICESTTMGLAVKFTVCCKSCKSEVFSSFSSPRGPKRFDINSRVVLASKENAVGYSKLSCMFSILNIPSMLSKSSYQDISVDVHNAAISAAEQSMRQAADVIRERYHAGVLVSDRESSSGCPVTTVSFDGTWQKRGHSSHNGVGVAIDVDTGLVVDTYTVCNFCMACEKRPEKDTEEFRTWHKSHEKLCQKNSDCSSNAMEVVAADKIFSRSVSKRGLVYGNMLCDGDSKAFTKVNETCGYDIDIEKLDCINHIAKRMFNSLETVKKEHKNELNRKLTRPMIDKITNTYATNLKDNAPDVEKMKMGVMGGILHMCSTDTKPNHRLCPKGETSWCPYNKALSQKKTPPTHRPTFKPEIVPFIWPTIVRLTDPDLLSRCAKMLTQNANESFNAQIWRRSPKTEFANRDSIETAVALATLSFNCGPCGLRLVMSRLDIRWEKTSHDYANKQIAEKVSRARRKTVGLSKWKRKHRKSLHIIKEHQREKQEGSTYQSGAFNF